jgi:hypothetical protein
MATDTAPYRNPRYHTTDMPDSLDYERLARASSWVCNTSFARGRISSRE